MTFPRQITVHGRRWKVRRERVSADDPEDFGQTLDDTSTVMVYDEMHEKFPDRGTPRSTLLHETVHAIIITNNINHLITDEIEEVIASAIEKGLYPLIQRGVFTEPKRGAKK